MIYFIINESNARFLNDDIKHLLFDKMSSNLHFNFLITNLITNRTSTCSTDLKFSSLILSAIFFPQKES